MPVGSQFNFRLFDMCYMKQKKEILFNRATLCWYWKHARKLVKTKARMVRLGVTLNKHKWIESQINCFLSVLHIIVDRLLNYILLALYYKCCNGILIKFSTATIRRKLILDFFGILKLTQEFEAHLSSSRCHMYM